MIVSAHDVTRVRLCASFGCADDAVGFSDLCERCQREGQCVDEIRVPLPKRYSDVGGLLWCSGACAQFKPDAEFFKRGVGDESPGRRGRRSSCKQCEIETRRERRLSDPDYNAKQAARRARARA